MERAILKLLRGASDSRTENPAPPRLCWRRFENTSCPEDISVRHRPLNPKIDDAITRWITLTAEGVFMGSVVAFALVVLAVPFWRGLGILVALVVLLIGVLLVLHWRRKRRSAPPRSP